MAGNAACDAETKELRKGYTVVTSVALNPKREGEERTHYIDVSAFGAPLDGWPTRRARIAAARA